MKAKTLNIMLIAAALTFSACGNKNEANAQNSDSTAIEQAADVIKDGKTFEGDHFTLVYPKELEETFSTGELLNAQLKGDEYCFLDATYNDFGPNLDQLGIYAENLTSMRESSGCKVDKPNIDGKVLTIRIVSEEKGRTEIHFVVMKEDRIGISGSLTFDSDKEAKYLPIAQSIVKSIKFK